MLNLRYLMHVVLLWLLKNLISWILFSSKVNLPQNIFLSFWMYYNWFLVEMCSTWYLFKHLNPGVLEMDRVVFASITLTLRMSSLRNVLHFVHVSWLGYDLAVLLILTSNLCHLRDKKWAWSFIYPCINRFLPYWF